jgi:hypothetical protein
VEARVYTIWQLRREDDVSSATPMGLALTPAGDGHSHGAVAGGVTTRRAQWIVDLRALCADANLIAAETRLLAVRSALEPLVNFSIVDPAA